MDFRDRAAIGAYAQANGIKVVRWFEAKSEEMCVNSAVKYQFLFL
jgi:hypothetical protein